MDIVRSVNGIKLPIRCYIAQGVYVGSCTYDDVCVILQTLLPDFKPGATCPADLAAFGIGKISKLNEIMFNSTYNEFKN